MLFNLATLLNNISMGGKCVQNAHLGYQGHLFPVSLPPYWQKKCSPELPANSGFSWWVSDHCWGGKRVRRLWLVEEKGGENIMEKTLVRSPGGSTLGSSGERWAMVPHWGSCAERQGQEWQGWARSRVSLLQCQQWGRSLSVRDCLNFLSLE